LKILIADDDDVSRLILASALQKLGYEVVAAENGLKALEAFRTDDFSVLISDWLMPGMDGPALCRELELAAAEALNNAIEHGCAGHPQVEIACRWKWTDETIQIEVTDAGNYQPPRGDPRLPDDPLAEEGRGAFLIARLVDTVEHALSAEGHLIRLTKRVALAETKAVRSNAVAPPS
jgi:anti-sigma regulatory factor (Ser/Thr protein kinase)